MIRSPLHLFSKDSDEPSVMACDEMLIDDVSRQGFDRQLECWSAHLEA